ncbi:TPA: Cro/CI family transcriptional regulator [Salmonella enterica subsp. enterica serovar Waycross]
MEKECVLDYFGGTTATAKFLGIAKSTVSVWPAKIPWKYAILLERLTEGKLKYDPDLYKQQVSVNTKTA